MINEEKPKKPVSKSASKKAIESGPKKATPKSPRAKKTPETSKKTANTAKIPSKETARKRATNSSPAKTSLTSAKPAQSASKAASINTARSSAASASSSAASPSQKTPHKHSFSFGYLSILFISAAFLGAAIFFINHPWGEYVFRNPFAGLKTIKHTVEKKLFTPTPNASFDYDTYKILSENISLDNKDNIENFINDNPNSSLSTQLRNKWLILLAEKSNWDTFLQDYQPTNNQAVECYHLRALYHSGQKKLALSGVKRLWLAGYKPSNACTPIFSAWQNSSDFKDNYVWTRLQTAVNANDSVSIKQLTLMLPAPEQPFVAKWVAIHKDPLLLTRTQLPNNAIGRRIIIDGLKQWANVDVHHAIQHWNALQAKYHFDEATSQDFYLTASLHLALNADPQAEAWFAKILPQYETTQSRAWQVRFALMHQNWPRVLVRIQKMPDTEQNNNIWKYWKARALQKTGNPVDANTLYNQLSNQRQYYGFLAAYQQNKALSIQQQDYPKDDALLAPYTQQILQIRQLHTTNQPSQALQLTQDLLNQLNPIGQYTLANLFAQWEWYSESMNIVNRLPYQSDLKLRFPMPHLLIIQQFCAPVRISPALVYAIGRQESNFHEDVFSAAGGLGILQLTLSTAKQFDPKITKQGLYDPTTNIRISIQYLTRLDKQFNEHPALIASAYNAGPQKTRNWQPNNTPIPADIWIETRPWEETRNYLKNISAYYAVYEYLLGETPNINAFMRDIPVHH